MTATPYGELIARLREATGALDAETEAALIAACNAATPALALCIAALLARAALAGAQP